MENGEQVVATFEFNGSVYNIQIVNPNSLLSVTTPTSTEYVIFNYWTVNGVEIDLSTYKISQNTKIVADVTYRYKTEFIVNDEVYNSQIVTLNDYATLPTNPSVSGYDFDGWTLNGIDLVDPTTIEITKDTQFIAKLTKLHKVKFYCENELIDEQIVRNGNFVEYFEPTLENAIFNGWTVNDILVDLTTYKIVAETILVADLTYPEFAVTYKVGNDIVSSQSIVLNKTSTVNNTPEKIGYKFLGWSIDGSNVIDIENNKISVDTVYTAVFEKLNGLYETGTHNLIYTWDELISNSIITVSSKTLTSANPTLLIGDLHIPKSVVTSMEDTAFLDCVGLTGITIPTSVTEFGSACFKGCGYLKFMSLPFIGKTVDEDYVSKAMFGYLFGMTEYENSIGCKQSLYTGVGEATTSGGGIYYFPRELKTVEVTGCSYIGNSDFIGCSFIENIILGDSITSIKMYAFNGCKGLKYIKLSTSLNSISYSAFTGCSSLETIYFPKYVRSIARYASWSLYAFPTTVVMYFNIEEKPANCYISTCTAYYGYSYADYLTVIGKGY